MRYTIYIARLSYLPEFKKPYVLGLGDSEAQFTVHVNAETRSQAAALSLPKLASQKEKLQGKYVSIFVGRNNPSEYPGRLNPIQIEIATWSFRDPKIQAQVKK